MKEEVKYGRYDLLQDSIPPESYFRLIIQPIDLTAFWNRCGLTANFTAAFCSYCSQDSEYFKNIVSTIVNELIENSAKYSKVRDATVTIDFKYYMNILRIEVTNLISDRTRSNFEKVVKRLCSTDLEEEYLKSLEVRDQDASYSGIGLLMLMKDYPADFGFKFRKIGEDENEIGVCAYLKKNDLSKEEGWTL
ncbi:GHKL domain protein [Leptospira inadai serovar Lyme str. 10]|uniref:GHKL domain protein n=2 Tax=Leptospira inadai serovar Lyme TaxID=293084 RepID=V6HCM2_9LEPT|nr:histidine kinase [Leptospira inadai]EQA37402.1 GHKL domain protein [Leptospira inadai serovar Lyme str. 10]PNV75128.1 histidine kinase [Leptospira inadai serovar Lyme]